MKDYKERIHFSLRTIFLEIPPSHPKMRLKSAPQKQLFNGKSYTKNHTPNCSDKCPCIRKSDNEIWSVNRI